MNAANQPAFTWADLTQQPEFQSADQTQREDMQLRYFQQVVAPSIPQSQYRELRDAFFESTLPDVEVKQPGLLRRSMDAIGGVRERLTPEAPTYDEGAWQEVGRSEAFLQGDTRARHDLRQQFFRDNVAGDLEGEARRQAERDFYAGTDIRGTVEGSDWRPDREGERRGLQTWESGSTGRPPVEGASSTSGTVEEAVGLVRSGAAGAVGAVGAATEGWGAIIQQADNVEANRSVADAEKRLLTTQRNMDEALAATTDEYRDQVAANYQRDLERRESELFEAMNKWAEREPNDAAAWLMKRGLDLREFAEQVDVDPESRTFLNDVAGGVGSMLTYLGPGMVANALTRGSMAAGMGVSLGMATPSGVSEAYTRAIAAGLSEEEALERSIAGAVPGAIQVAPLASLIKGVPPHMRGKALGELYGILRTGAQEGVVEGLGQIGQNFIERFYNEDRGLTEGAGRAAAVGAVSGGVTHGLTTSSREFALGDQGRLGQAMQAEADSLQFVDDADALARQALDPEGAQMRQIEPGTPEWEAQWRAHEQQNDLAPIDLQQDTGISATVSPGAPEAGGMEVGGLIDGGMRQDTPAQAAQAEDALTGELLRTPATEDAPEIARAQQSLAMGDGFAFLWERAGGDQGAQEALNRMQEAYLQGDGDGAATAYQEAMQTIRANERRGAQQERKQAAIEQAREQVAAEGGDALSQTIAGEQAEAQANALSEQENAADPIFRPAPPTSPLAGQTMPVGPGSVVDQQAPAGEPQAGQPLTDETQAPSASADLTSEPAQGARPAQRVAVDQIQTDPDAYQFRADVNERGVDARMDGVQQWDDVRADNLVLHEREDGSLFVADGHHRLDLARRLGQPEVNAIILREADGVDVRDARRIAAEGNISRGNATAVDAAKVFRDRAGTPEQIITERNLPRRSQVVRDGADLAQLGDEAFGAVVNQVIGEKDGAAIGRAITDPAQQLAAVEVFQQVQPQNDNQRALLINEIQQAGFAEGQTEQGGLFGDDPMQSLIGERVRVMDALHKDLSRDRRLFATLNRNARTAETAGNVIATEANEAMSDSAARAMDLLGRVATNPAMNQQINDAARRVSEGQPVAQAVTELKEVLRRGPDAAATQPDRASDDSGRPAQAVGQEQRRDQRQPAPDDARAAGAGEQRLAGTAAGEGSAEGRLSYRANGAPFATEASAMASGVARRARAQGQPVEAVPVEGGFAVRTGEAAQEAAAPQEASQTAETHMRANGQPFASERSAMMSGIARRAQAAGTPVQAVPVEGGFAVQVGEAQTARADVDTADTSAQRVEESPIDRQVAFEEGVDPIAGYRLRDHIASGKRPAYQIHQDGEGVTVVTAGTGMSDIGSVQVTLTPDEARALKRAQQDRELADTTEEIEAARAAERAAVTPAIERAVGLNESTPPLTLETQTEESLAAREQETQAAEQAEAEQRRQEAQRAQADRDADDFLLTGSDSAADQAMARGQDSLFRLEPPADVTARRDAIAEAIGQHPELAGVQPVARVAELPVDAQIAMLTQGIDPRSVRGVFVGGELYVVAENVANTGEGVKVAVHEAVGHRGVREVLGDRLAPEMRRLYASFPHSHETFQLVRARYPHLDTTTREGRQEFAEELVAHLAEANPQVNAWQRFVARVRDMLRQVFPEVAWTENDVRALIQRSRETLAEQALADGTFVAEEGDTSFSLSEAPGEPRSLEGAATREEVESRLMQGMTQQERAELFTDAEWAQIVDATMAETAQPAEAPQISELQQQLQDEHPGLELFTTQRGDVATIQRIELPAAQREQGTGTQIMEQITGWADENGITLALTPTADFGGAVGRLRDFYQRHGFADNTGRARDHAISETMVRRPAGGEDVLFSLRSVVRGDGQEAGVPLPEAQRVAEDFLAHYNGNVPLELRVVNRQEEAYGPENTRERIGAIKGAYHPGSGQLVLVAANLRDAQDGRRTLRHEVVGHYGLNTFRPEVKRAILDRVLETEDVPSLRAAWQHVNDNYPAESTPADIRAEEVFAFAAEQERGRLGAAWDRVLAQLNRALRHAGLTRHPLSRAELHELAETISREIHDGRRQQQTFPATDQDQFRREQPADAAADAGGDRLTAARDEALSGLGEGTVGDRPDPQAPVDPSDTRFSLDADRPTATQVRDSLQGIEGLGRPEVLDTANQLDLDTGLRLTLRGLDPQAVVAFHDDAGRLRVIAGNAESPQAAVQAAVLERVKRNGLGAVLGDRLNTIGKNAYGQLPGNTAAREVLRTVRAEYDYLNPSLPGDRTVLALEVINRLQERGNAPTFATETMEQVRALLGERYGISDAGNLARANRAYLDRMQRDYGRKRPPAPPAFQLDMQDTGGTGTLLDLNPQVIDGDGNVISDARVASFWTFNPFQQLGNFVFSQSDRLRASGSRPLVELGNRIDRYFDQSDRRLGVVNAILREPLKAMQQGMPKARKERQRLFEQYWRDWDNGRREAAQAIYDANPTVAAMVDAAVEMFHQTGLENQSVKTPTRTGMWVFDGKGYRKIGKIRRGEFWPRALRREVQAVLQDPSADPALWRELVDALVDGGHAKDRQEAGTMLMDRSRGYFNEQVTRDYFAGIEKARGEKLPEIFYDYSLDVVADYASKWAMRISQAEQFGQKLRPTDKDAFDEAMGMAADKRSEKFIGQVRDNIYGAQNIGMYGEFMGNANVLATGLHLGNWATASQNLTTGSALNVQMFGARRVAKAYAELVRDWDTIYREGVAEGILGKDVMNLIRDTDSHHDANVFSPDSQTGRFHKLMERFNAGNMSGREMIREFSRLAMKYGGYNATEQMIRANAFVAAKAQLADALHAWNQKPSSLDAKKYRRFMGRNRIDVDALIRENGKGEETSKYLRLMVNLPQGSYRADQAPLYVDTQIGRFFFKYQKFGTQVSRLFWQQRIKPALELTFDKNATAADRVDAYLDILHYIGTGVAAGFLNRKIRSLLFGMAFVGPDWDEIWKRFNDDGWWASALWFADMAFHSAMSAGSIFGFFGSPMQSVIDFRDGQRVKNPMEPPGFAVFQGIQSLGVKFWQQGGYLSVPDVRDAVLREVSLPRVADRTAQSALNAIGADLDRTKLEMNRRDVGYIRGAARRWADVEGIEARASGSFSPGSTENTPANNRIHDAVSIGDQARARQLILDELQGLSVDERRSRLRSIRATLRARHPLRLAGNTMNQEQQDAFKRWASQSLPPSRWETIQEVTNTYDRTLEGALWRIQ